MAISVMFILGTRPEVIKLAPVIIGMRADRAFHVRICSTGQHREMLDQALNAFGLLPDIELSVMTPDQTLSGLTARLLEALDEVYVRENPAFVIVQGDTTTAMAGALAAFYRGISVGHVEAGLRTKNKYSPFPEEINRRLIGSVADIHFAPTQNARNNLVREGVDGDNVIVTGNTAIDALLMTVNRELDVPWEVQALSGDLLTEESVKDRRLVLVTAHRRENHDKGLFAICSALSEVAHLPGALILFAVHLNPRVRKTVLENLRGLENIYLTEPLDYVTFSRVMKQSFLILTDSGGIQEEAPSLGRPVIVMRDNTERQEGIDVGNATLAGADTARIVSAVSGLWADASLYDRMAAAPNPYGDGHSTERIIAATRTRLITAPRGGDSWVTRAPAAEMRG